MEVEFWLKEIKCNIGNLTKKDVSMMKELYQGQFTQAYAHLIITSIRQFILDELIRPGLSLNQIINAYESSNVKLLLHEFYIDSLEKLTKYDEYLIDAIEVEYLSRIISKESLLASFSSIFSKSSTISILLNNPFFSDSLETRQISSLLEGKPERKEMLILALFSLYDNFITEKDSSVELSKKYIIIFKFLKQIEKTGFFLQIFSQKFKTIFTAKNDAMKTIIFEILPNIQKPNSFLGSVVEDDMENCAWEPDPI